MVAPADVWAYQLTSSPKKHENAPITEAAAMIIPTRSKQKAGRGRGSDEESEDEESADDLERCDDRQGCEHEHRNMGPTGPHAQSCGFSLVEGEREERSVQQNAGQHSEAGCDCEDDQVVTADTEHVTEQEAREVDGKGLGMGHDDHADGQHSDEEQSDADDLGTASIRETPR